MMVLNDYFLSDFQLPMEAAKTRACRTRVKRMCQKDVSTAGFIFGKNADRNDHLLA